MKDLASTSRLLAAEMRQAERSINLATRDAAHFLLTTLDATEAHGFSPAIAHRTVKATVTALAALVEGQEQMALRAHPSLEKVGVGLGLTVTNWGEGAPKPAMDDRTQVEAS